MKARALSVLVAAILAAPLQAPADAAPRGGRAPISLRLLEAPADQVFQGFATALGGELSIDPRVAGRVTLELEDVAIQEALDATCDQLGCHWQVIQATPPVLRVSTGEPGSQLITLSLLDADVGSILSSFTAILGVGVYIDPEITGSLSIELRKVPWWEALDAVCLRAGCRWWYESEPTRLRLEKSPAAPGEGGAERSGPRRVGELRRGELRLGTLRLVAPPPAPRRGLEQLGHVALDLRLVPPGGVAVPQRLLLSWDRPLQGAAAVDGRWTARVSWIPLREGRSVVLPILEHCDAAGHRKAFSFDPLRLPLQEPWVAEWQEARLELRPVAGETATASSQPEEGGRCGPPRPVRVSLRGGGEDELYKILHRPGEFVQVLSPPAPGRVGPAPELVVILLGEEVAGRPVVGVLATGEASMERFTLSPASPWTGTFPLADGSSVTLEAAAL